MTQLSTVPSSATSGSADLEFLPALRAGDPGAFSALHAQYAPLLISLAARQTDDKAIAEDLVQDVFLTMWANRDRLAGADSPVGYLFQAVRHRVSNYHRRRRVEAAAAAHNRIGTELAEEWYPQSEVDRGIDASWLHTTIEMAVEQLPTQARATYRLVRGSQLSYADAARRLGLSVKTVEMHMTRALRQLRAQLGTVLQ